ncbi:MAG: hypothetical protein HY710_07025 [Candidatus Latescibacteria bacterium]|nr:hypothetical protein [Candidatus Latescibacterota bacterium]
MSSALDLPALWNAWETDHLSRQGLSLLSHDEVIATIQRIVALAPGLARAEVVGHSVEGRAITLVTAGHGPFPVLLWSQMHGDEPTATGGLLDVLAYLLTHRDVPWAARILDRLTLLAIPMLNPDGAARRDRRNAQGIDINRDAQRLQTPEGRTLKAVRDRFQPEIGFNLHNQSARITVGQTKRIAAISLLSAPYDALDSTDARRLRAKKVATVIHDAVARFVPGHVARYDDPFNPPAFGDSMTMWGTSSVLVESGGWPGITPEPTLVKLNVVGLLAGLDALANGTVDQADAAVYESLPLNGREGFDLLIRGATVLDGTGLPPIVADLGVNVDRTDRLVDDRPARWTTNGWIADYGDLQLFGAMEMIDGNRLVILPGLIRPVPALTVAALLDGGSRDEARRGFTTTLVSIPTATDALREMMRRLKEQRLSCRAGLIAELDRAATEADHLLSCGNALAAGLLGLHLREPNPPVAHLSGIGRVAGWFGRTVILEINEEQIDSYVTATAAINRTFGARFLLRLTDGLTDLDRVQRAMEQATGSGVTVTGRVADSPLRTGGYPVLDAVEMVDGFVPVCDDGFILLADLTQRAPLERVARLVQRMTAATAAAFGLADRGLIRKGLAADLLVIERADDATWRPAFATVNGERV